MKYVRIAEIVALVLFGAAHATVWYVHPDSTLNAIQAGLDSCADNDTVLVGAGTYIENIVWPSTDGIALMSEYGRDTTIIDGSGSDAVIHVHQGDPAIVISGFTIQNGYGNTGFKSGGVYLTFSGELTIKNNFITNNDGIWAGGITCEYSSPLITENIITYNTCDTAGGGILCISGSNPTISNNEIAYNEARWAGGIYSASSHATITGNHIHNNTATIYGGGIGITWASGGTVKHNTIEYNQTNTGIGGGIYLYNYATPTIDSCDITNNTEGIYNSLLNSTPMIHYCNITDNIGFAARSISTTIDCENNWWGDATGPYHPTLNPGGLGDTVSDYVDFDPWLLDPVFPGIEEQPIVKPLKKQVNLGATIFSGPLHMPEGKECRVFDITGRVVMPDKMKPGIYFIEVDDTIVQKVIKIK